MRWSLLLVPLVLAACAGSGGAHRAAPPGPSFTVRMYGRGATRSWVYTPKQSPRLVVLFVHGLGDQRETTPYHHRAWLAHMAREGFEVVYPAYEARPFQPGGLEHLIQGVAGALPHVRNGLPVAAIGYSRGGRLVVDYASVSSVTGLVPARVLSVFPSGRMDALLDLGTLTGHTKVLILAGDSDTTVRNIGADELVTQLAASGFPYPDVKYETVRSHDFFVADHLSVLDDSAGARKAFWARADRFFAPVALRR